MRVADSEGLRSANPTISGSSPRTACGIPRKWRRILEWRHGQLSALVRKLEIMYRRSIAQCVCAQSRVRAREGLDTHVYTRRYLQIHTDAYRQVRRHICECIPVCAHMNLGVPRYLYTHVYIHKYTRTEHADVNVMYG